MEVNILTSDYIELKSFKVKTFCFSVGQLIEMGDMSYRIADIHHVLYENGKYKHIDLITSTL